MRNLEQNYQIKRLKVILLRRSYDSLKLVMVIIISSITESLKKIAQLIKWISIVTASLLLLMCLRLSSSDRIVLSRSQKLGIIDSQNFAVLGL